MKSPTRPIVALLFLATCTEGTDDLPPTTVETTSHALGVLPPGEVGIWQNVGYGGQPGARYLQAAVFDESRRVLVTFGGANKPLSSSIDVPNQETWEWSPVSGKWNRRIGTGDIPIPRAGAAMAFDSTRGKVVLFGGNGSVSSSSLQDIADTWEWDPTTGVWTAIAPAGPQPSARSRHGMVYEKTTGKILLFGGYSVAAGAVVGDTWEYDSATRVWSERKPSSPPSGRESFGLVWDAAHAKAVLFGGSQGKYSSYDDVWEWDAAGATWAERKRTSAAKPLARYGHAMAYDGNRKRVVVFGGYDNRNLGESRGVSLKDVWDWDPETGAWTTLLAGTEGNLPAPRSYASLVSDDKGARLELFAGAVLKSGGGASTGAGGAIYDPRLAQDGATASDEVWELDPAKPAFSNRTLQLIADHPTSSAGQAMAFNPATGKTYLFGGEENGKAIDELWAWDGKAWERQPADVRPTPRWRASLAYDPVRLSLILYGGSGNSADGSSIGGSLDDTWEWSPGKKWTQLRPAKSPALAAGHGMVTDSARGKLILFGGHTTAGAPAQVWEWDGAAATWTQRTTLAWAGPSAPWTRARVAFDEGRRKLVVLPSQETDIRTWAYWEWDPLTGGWASSATTEGPGDRGLGLAYDSIRRRHVSSEGTSGTWELDAEQREWYLRPAPVAPSEPSNPNEESVSVFDSVRGVVVLYVGGLFSETWEYKVTHLANGGGCTAALATSCASGNCVDGVCCASAACSGACKSCNVPGSEGTCALASAGTQVSGSCAAGQACDATGSCKVENGQPCTGAGACASGFCVDGVCCNGACTGACRSCNQVGRVGTCAPATAGSDPEADCGQGTGVCKSTCDGAFHCTYPSTAVTCAEGQACDGSGACKVANGQPCTAPTSCASGFCADGVCCDGACTDTCMACNRAIAVGTCMPYDLGSDPEGECGQGTGVCKSTCSGTGRCSYPSWETSCGDCTTCDGNGSCSQREGSCTSTGGGPGGAGGQSGAGGSPLGSGSAGAGGGTGTGTIPGATTKVAKRSGCECTLGRESSQRPGIGLLVMLGGLGCSLLRRRRNRP
jgi:N-acetylneuraminic acid mutarotase